MSRAVFLTGTSATETPKHTLSAKLLSAEFDNGALRWIRWRGVEVLRALTFLVRTPGWGTPEPQISGLDIQQGDDSFEVNYQANYINGDEQVSVNLRFAGRSDGVLSASAQIIAASPFATNRTGFVVLYPLDGFAGSAVQVEHAAGGSAELTIPDAISPGQPIFDIRAITHQPIEGLSVTTRFDGDTFEAEDHRNWSDASFKIYSRPIGLPYPYQLLPEQALHQSVSMNIRDNATLPADVPAINSAASVYVAVGAPTEQRIPAIGLGLSADKSADALAYAPQLANLGPVHFLLRYDPAAQHQIEHLAAASQLASRTHLPVAFELLLTASHDPATEIAQAAKLLKDVGISPISVAIFPKIDERSFQPGEIRPPSPSDSDIYREAKKAFPGIPIGGGSPAFFTEFNRKRPAAGTFDFITHATAPTVHAADDASVIETLQSLPHIIRSARHIIHTAKQIVGSEKPSIRNVPYHIGPIGIGARLNPYGSGPVANPDSARVGLAENDPRQRGLFAAAWHVGYAAIIAEHGVDTLVMAAPTGPFGVISTPQNYAREWWDEQGDGPVYPLFHVAADLAAGHGKPRLATASSSEKLAVIGWQESRQNILLLANLSSEPVSVTLADVGVAQVRILDVAHSELAALSPDRFRQQSDVLDTAAGIRLDAYAVARISYQRN
ncbi:hypothetical protein [Yersinia hibernica]|uniref:Uncharacterized protein n=1 Tax=Yersinia enterocolitica LC20 TaxID=1443113 RepID=A0A7U4GH46_YEREN|nr:hypothetical protein [Yersinia hibernica]AHM75231.1 hypothetical protein LC20_03978 [Yersinia hibernica]OVZ90313.1 hypothetical protein CBW54_07370 [Yersinia kristensenii]